MTIKPAPIIAIPNVPETRVEHRAPGSEYYDGLEWPAEAYFTVSRPRAGVILFGVAGEWT